jgi:hypothetical protein
MKSFVLAALALSLIVASEAKPYFYPPGFEQINGFYHSHPPNAILATDPLLFNTYYNAPYQYNFPNTYYYPPYQYNLPYHALTFSNQYKPIIQAISKTKEKEAQDPITDIGPIDEQYEEYDQEKLIDEVLDDDEFDYYGSQSETDISSLGSRTDLIE